MRRSRWLIVLLLGAAVLAISVAGPGRDAGGSLPPAQARVQNGDRAFTKDHPYMVALSHNPIPVGAGTKPDDPDMPSPESRDSRSGVICGGTLTEERFVITAAHCVTTTTGAKTEEPLWVIARRDDLSRRDGTEVRVKHISVHPDYQKRSKAEADVAVLTLARELQGSLPLATAEDGDIDTPGTQATLLGYGLTGPDAEQSQYLLSAQIPIRPRWECGYMDLENSLLCGGGNHENDGQLCHRDSGGPLISRGRLIGVIQGVGGLGPGKCAEPLNPGIFARARSYSGLLGEVIAAEQHAAGDARSLPIRDYSCANDDDGAFVGTIRVHFAASERPSGATKIEKIQYRIKKPKIVPGGKRAYVRYQDARMDKSTDEGKQNGEFHALVGAFDRPVDVPNRRASFSFVFDTRGLGHAECQGSVPNFWPERPIEPLGRQTYMCSVDGFTGGIAFEFGRRAPATDQDSFVDAVTVTRVRYQIFPGEGGHQREEADIRVTDDGGLPQAVFKTGEGEQDNKLHDFPDDQPANGFPYERKTEGGKVTIYFMFDKGGWQDDPTCVLTLPDLP